ncbi:MAG: septal ring lytic transglycosylase RlpA family protein [Alphaproteobacteria bacterium]|nr:septal ring lytic transglycosylase RlpA family protein [Alphaproteobacteria bacterium]
MRLAKTRLTAAFRGEALGSLSFRAGLLGLTCLAGSPGLAEPRAGAGRGPAEIIFARAAAAPSPTAVDERISLGRPMTRDEAEAAARRDFELSSRKTVIDTTYSDASRQRSDRFSASPASNQRQEFVTEASASGAPISYRTIPTAQTTPRTVFLSPTAGTGEASEVVSSTRVETSSVTSRPTAGAGSSAYGTTGSDLVREQTASSYEYGSARGSTYAPIRYNAERLPPISSRDSQDVSALTSAGSVEPMSSPGFNAPIDLRPSAVRASYSAAAAVYRRAPSPRESLPLAAGGSPGRSAEPYAGPPYEVDGKWYVPAHEPDYDEVGLASWYGPTFHGKVSATGEVFDEMALTAAHPTLPIPSMVRVTNLANGRSAVLRLNDRGPFVDDRIIDLSKGAAIALDMKEKGVVQVRVQYEGPAPQAGPEARLASVEAPRASEDLGREATVARPNGQAQRTALPPLAIEPAPAGVAPTGGYFVQVGAFADLGNAHRRKAELAGVGPLSVSPIQRRGSEYFRVLLGPWKSRAEAEDARDRLGPGGEGALIVSSSDK